MGRRYRSGWWLEEKYWEEGWTQAEIAGECEVSPRCIRKWMYEHDVERRELVGENHPQYGSERSAETREKISETLEGREFSEETIERFREARRNAEIPEETREKIAESLAGLERPEETRKKMSEAQSGEGNPRWRGGVSDSYGPGWNRAREQVRKRDERCRNCDHGGSERRLEVTTLFRFGCLTRPRTGISPKCTPSGIWCFSVVSVTSRPRTGKSSSSRRWNRRSERRKVKFIHDRRL
jgi:hypothetical protein